jgi:hypothetical protein
MSKGLLNKTARRKKKQTLRYLRSVVPMIELRVGRADVGVMTGTPPRGFGTIELESILCPVEGKWDCRMGELIETVIV